MSVRSPHLTPVVPVSEGEEPVSAPEKVVSMFEFFPVSMAIDGKSNISGLFACTFLKISPSEHMRGRGCSSSGKYRKYIYFSDSGDNASLAILGRASNNQKQPQL